MSQEFDNNTLDLVMQKGFYPYEYMSDFEHLNKELTIKKKFYNSLTNRKIIDTENDHILKVWNKFEIKTMKDYHHSYLKWEVLLLVDFVINRLCPSNYLRAPGLSWNVCLK